MNWKTILVPHDFSSSANHATSIARNEAKAHGSKLLLLHVIQLPSQFHADAAIVPDGGAPISLREYAVKQAEAHLEDLSARLAKDGVAAQTFLRIGSPVDEILTFVTENGVDLIIMGTHGRSGVAKMLAGSVAERIVRSSDIPVLTTRHPE